MDKQIDLNKVPATFAKEVIWIMMDFPLFIDRLKELRIAEVKRYLDLLTSKINHIVEQCEEMARILRVEANRNEKNLEAAEQQIARIELLVKQLNESYAQLNINIEKNKASLNELNRQQNDLQQEYNHLQSEYNQIRERLEELKKWCWVPGYGLYLSIRTIANNDINQIQHTADELNHIEYTVQNQEREKHILQQRQQQVSEQLHAIEEQMRGYKHDESLLLESRVFYKQQIVIFSTASYLFTKAMKIMQQLMESVQFERALLELDSMIDVDCIEDIKGIGKVLEEGCKNVVTVGHKIRCINKALFVQHFRVKWEGGASDWSSNYAINKSAEFDLKQFPIPDGTEVWIEVKAVLGRTVECKERIWFLRNSSDEVTYQTKGTTLAYSIKKVDNEK